MGRARQGGVHAGWERMGETWQERGWAGPGRGEQGKAGQGVGTDWAGQGHGGRVQQFKAGKRLEGKEGEQKWRMRWERWVMGGKGGTHGVRGIQASLRQTEQRDPAMSMVRGHASLHPPTRLTHGTHPSPAASLSPCCPATPSPRSAYPTPDSQQAPRATVATSSSRQVTISPTGMHHRQDQRPVRHNQPEASPGELGNPWKPQTSCLRAAKWQRGGTGGTVWALPLFKDGNGSTPKCHPLPVPGPPWVPWAPTENSPVLGWAPSPSCPVGSGCMFS